MPEAEISRDPSIRATAHAGTQRHCDLAMATSNEKGPCRCWRWDVFGGLGKLLIREHGFTVAQIWNLSDGCGGDAHMHN